MAQNPNWPVIMEDWGPYWNANAGDIPLDRYTEVTSRVIGPTSVKRGRQYELDQVRAGEYSATLDNLDGSLDPLNSNGPWYGHVNPYTPYRKRAQWPPTQNLLTRVLAAGGYGYTAGAIPGGASGIDVFSDTDSGPQIVASGTAYYGSNVFQFNVPSGTANASKICYTMQPGVVPGRQYSQQIFVRNVTASTSLAVQVYVTWWTAAGGKTTVGGTSTTLTGSTTAAWAQLTVTATAPANAAGMEIGLLCGPASATCSIQNGGWQLEKASAPTSWTLPGVWYPLYSGFVERWPASWEFGGTYGQVKPTAVDAFALLSQVTLNDPLTQEINSHNPRFLYTLSDPSGSQTFADQTGNYPAATIEVSKYGPGSITAGNQITSATSGGMYSGSTGSVVTIANQYPGQAATAQASLVSLSGAGITGPNSSAWTRMVAFRYTGPNPPASGAYIWCATDKNIVNGNTQGSEFAIYLDSSSHCIAILEGPTGAYYTYQLNSTNYADGNWHLFQISYNPSTAMVYVYIDGSGGYWTGVSSSVNPTGCTFDNLGAFVNPTVGNGTTETYQGDLSFVAEFPTALDNTSMPNIYKAWKSSFSGESSDARYARILGYAGYKGASSIQTGLTTSVGPANDIAGQDALSALQGVVDTENGEHFIAKDGTVTFRARSARYNATTPAYVFGENTANGEYPYEECQLDYDPTHLANIVQMTQESTGQIFKAQDPTSVANFFPRSLQRTNNASSGVEVLSAANYLLSRYKNPAVRVTMLKLHPSANNNLWPVCLSLELGMRVRVMRRPYGGAAPIQVDCFIEQIQVDMDDKGEAFWTLQCSPADLTPYGLFAAWHSTLNAGIAAGVSSFVVNAPANNTTPLNGQIGYGQQIVLGQGTANQETVTVQSATSTGNPWTTGTVTLQSATTKSHSASDVVCGPLPSGVTDPTTWDAVSKFDSAAFAY